MTSYSRRTVPAVLAAAAGVALAAVTLGPAVAGSLGDALEGGPAAASIYPDPPTPRAEVTGTAPAGDGGCVVSVAWTPVGGMVQRLAYAVTDAEPTETSSDAWLAGETRTTDPGVDVTVAAGTTRWVTVTAETGSGGRSGSSTVAATC